jgi:uncharacterized membrane protein
MIVNDLAQTMPETRDVKIMPPPRPRTRLDAIDLLRGLVMVLMALDHTRAMFSNATFDPLDLNRTSTALFLTRWVTHFCAPVFVFLAGTGAFLYGCRGRTRAGLAWFLLTRGLWLVLLEFTLVHLGWWFRFDFHILLAQVIWAIGWSMVLMAGLVFLPTWAITGIGILLVAGHNAFDNVNSDRLGTAGWLWTALVRVGTLELPLGSRVIVAYPVLPWLGIMLTGYGCGTMWLLDPARRRRWLVGLGTLLILLFVVLRAGNLYGDPRNWSPQETSWFTVLDFINCLKYPPSLLYALMTLGPALLALAWFDRPAGPLGRPLIVFGRVPLFYYLLHVPLIHLVALAFAYVRYGQVSFLLANPLFAQRPDDYGYGLGVVYLVWAGVVLALYFPCRWFAAVKQRHPGPWMSYF